MSSELHLQVGELDSDFLKNRTFFLKNLDFSHIKKKHDYIIVESIVRRYLKEDGVEHICTECCLLVNVPVKA